MMPILIPELKMVKSDISEVIRDWDTNEEMEDKFSNTKIMLNNIGKESAVDIRYNFRLENENKLGDYLEGVNEIEKKSSNNYMRIEDNGFSENVTSILYKKLGGNEVSKEYKMDSYTRKVSSISSQSVGELYLPSYFIALVNYNFRVNHKHARLLPVEMPILHLEIRFKDIYLKSWSVKYLIFMSTVAKTINDAELTTSIEYWQCQKMKRVRKQYWRLLQFWK